MKRVKLLFVTHPSEQRHYYKSPLFHSNACFQLKAWIESCPDLAERVDVQIALLDGQPAWRHGRADEDDTHILDRILRDPPDIVAFSLYVWNVVPLHSLLQALKQIAPQLLAMAGGPEVCDRPSFAETYPGFDILIEGDGEKPLREVLSRYLGSTPDYRGIPNVSVLQGGTWMHNPKRSMPAEQDLVPNYYRTNADLLYGRAFFLTTRGCSHGCDYCLWARQPLSQKGRTKAVEELETLMLGGKIRHLTLFDYDLLDIYRSDAELFKALASLRQRAGPGFDLRFFTNPHSLPDPALGKLVKDLDLRRLIVGVQSTDANALNAVHRGWALRQGLPFEKVPAEIRPYVLIELIFPLPGETSESFLATLRHLLGLGYFRLRIFNLMVFRGTRLHRNQHAMGLGVLKHAPYLCYQTPTVTLESFLRMSMVAHVISLLSMAIEPFDQQVNRLTAYFQGHPELVDRILAGVDARREPDDLLRELVEEILGIRYDGGFCLRDFDGAVSLPVALSPELSVAKSTPAATRASQTLQLAGAASPMESSFRSFFAGHGMQLERLERTAAGLDLSVRSSDGPWRLTLSPRRADVPHYCVTLFYKIAYSGHAPLAVVDAFAEHLRALEQSRGRERDSAARVASTMPTGGPEGIDPGVPSIGLSGSPAPAAAHSTLRVIGVGAGRDGTNTLTLLIRELARANGASWKAVHDLHVGTVSSLATLYLETGLPFYSTAVKDLLRNPGVDAVVGTAYHFVLDQLLEVHGPGLKLIHLRRRDRQENIRSQAYLIHYRPATAVNLTTDRVRRDHPEYTLRPAAWHFDEMSKEAWEQLSLEQRLAWHYDKSHAIIDAASDRFQEVLQLETESLSEPSTIARIASFLDPSWTQVCPPIVANSREAWENERANNERIRAAMIEPARTDRNDPS